MVVDFSFPWNKKQNLSWRGNTSGDSQGQRKLEPVEVSDVFCIVSLKHYTEIEWNGMECNNKDQGRIKKIF